MPALVAVTMVTAIVSSLGAPLIPDVAATFDVSLQSAQWSLTVALLAAAVAAPVLGWLGDGPRRRQTILGTLIVVIVGSVIAGLASSLPVLCVGRVMQGIGVALVPTTIATARDHLPAHRAAGVIGILSVTGAAAVGAAYPLSGLIATGLGIHAAFLFGGVATAAALLAAARAIPPNPRSEPQTFDVLGVFVLTLALIALLLAIGQGEQWGWGSSGTLGLFGAAFLLSAFWVPYQLAREHPLVRLRNLAIRDVLIANLGALLLGAALYMFFTLVSALVQVPSGLGYGYGGSALTAGLCLVPFSIAGLLTSRLIAQVSVRYERTLVAGTLLIAASGLLFVAFHGALWEAFAIEAMMGIGFGLTMAVMPGMIARAVPSDATGGAMGLWIVTRYIGFSIGSAAAATILAANVAHDPLAATEQGYMIGLAVASGLCIASAVATILVSRRGRRPA